MAKTPSESTSPEFIVHEISNDQLKHRVAIFTPYGVEAGRWYPVGELATLNDYVANYGVSGLPSGVFEVNEVNYKTLES